MNIEQYLPWYEDPAFLVGAHTQDQFAKSLLVAGAPKGNGEKYVHSSVQSGPRLHLPESV